MKRVYSIVVAGLFGLVLASRALAGITVTSYQTTAATNGFAPVGSTEFIEEQTLTNVSPAIAQVMADWTGPNADGTPATWRFVGSSSVTSTTAFDSDHFRVTASGQFQYLITTTPDFVDPSSASVFSPGGAARYNGIFTIDVPVQYEIAGQLNQLGRVRLNSLDGLVVFDQINFDANPIQIDLSGTIPAGQYRVLITASLGASNLPNGVNSYARSGSYEKVTFTVQVPEPSGGIAAVAGFMLVSGIYGRGRSRAGAV